MLFRSGQISRRETVSNRLLFVDLNEGVKTTTGRIHRIISPWYGLDDHRVDPPTMLRLWMGVRGEAGCESEFVFPKICNDGELQVCSAMSDAEWTTDMKSLLTRSGVKRNLVSRISTHSCRRGGVQLMLDLGYSFSTVMEIGGWDSVENFLV